MKKCVEVIGTLRAFSCKAPKTDNFDNSEVRLVPDILVTQTYQT